MKAKTPQVTDLLMYKGFVEWIRVNVSRDRLRELGHSNPHDAAAWFFAVRQAEEVRELSGRELAELICGGLPSLKTKTSMARILSEMWRNEPEPGQTWKDVRLAAARDLLTELEEFFLR